METQQRKDRLAALAEDRLAEESTRLEQERQAAAEEAHRRGCALFIELPHHGYTYHRRYMAVKGGLVFRVRAGAGPEIGYSVEG